jgi:26S proteasome regulatory subunit N10
MPLESCMILLDNSEFMRNGDYIPNRLQAQQDAANLLVSAKTQSHPESTVGVSAGTDLLVSPTEDVGKILNALHGLPFSSFQADVSASVQVASLALKHRRNKNGCQRIVLFVGSPLDGIEIRALAKVGRQLKKNNVAIDVVAMGELLSNEEKLRELVDAANGRSEDGGERTCHLVTIPAGVLPSDVLASSPIVHGGSGGSAFAASAAAGAAAGGGGDFGGSGGGGGGGGGFGDYGGVDPNMDPELAMALRVSMEEERTRQERVAAATTEQEAGAGGESKDAEMTDANATATPATPATANSTLAAAAMDIGLSEEEALLQQALAMSMNEDEPTTTPATGGAEATPAGQDSKPAAASEAMETEEDDEAEAMQMALQMSMQAAAEGGSSGSGQPQQFQDPQFVNELLGSLPGVDPNDPAIQAALQNLKKKEGDDKKEGDKE